MIVRQYCRDNNIRYRIFRPSTLCGSLIENKIGATPKFDVFYAWAAFFLEYKKRTLGSDENLYQKPFDFPEMVDGSQSFRWANIENLEEEELSFPVDRYVLQLLKKA